MQLHMDPDFCGWTDPEWPDKRWRLTEEQWYLVTKAFMRELARANTIEGPLLRDAEWRGYAHKVSLLLKAAREDKCHFMADVPWGTRIDWRQYSCLASVLAQMPMAMGILTLALGSSSGLQDGQNPCPEIRDVLDRLIGSGGAQVVCSMATVQDLTYMSGLSLMNAPADPRMPYDAAHNAMTEHWVERAWADSGGHDDHAYPGGYPGPNAQLVDSATMPSPDVGFKPVPGHFSFAPGPGGMNWNPIEDEDKEAASVLHLVFASAIGLLGFGFVAATLMISSDRGRATRNPASGKAPTIISASEAGQLPVGSIVFSWVKDKYAPYGRPADALVVIGGGQLTPIAVLPERADGEQPGGDNADLFGSQFVVVSQGRGKLPTHGTAQKAAMKWMNSR